MSKNIPGDNILVLPANLVAETANGAVLAAGAQTQDTESLGNNDALLLVVGRGDTLEDLEALHSGGTTGGLVGNHAADSLVENAGRSAEVEGTTTGGVETSHLAKVGVVLDCTAEFRVSILLPNALFLQPGPNCLFKTAQIFGLQVSLIVVFLHY